LTKNSRTSTGPRKAANTVINTGVLIRYREDQDGLHVHHSVEGERDVQVRGDRREGTL
jgi:hypothetical protein